MQPVTAEPRFHFRGGDVVLDFLNTVGWRLRAEPLEFLVDYDAAVGWLREAGLLPEEATNRVTGWARQNPAAAGAAVRRVRRFRESLYEVLAPIAVDRPSSPGALQQMTVLVRHAARARSLTWTGGTLAWTWDDLPDPSLTTAMARLVWAAAELIDRGETARIRQCAGDPCGWLFLDTSKAGNRRWCSMADCGNLAKVRRHRERRRS